MFFFLSKFFLSKLWKKNDGQGGHRGSRKKNSTVWSPVCGLVVRCCALFCGPVCCPVWQSGVGRAGVVLCAWSYFLFWQCHFFYFLLYFSTQIFKGKWWTVWIWPRVRSRVWFRVAHAAPFAVPCAAPFAVRFAVQFAIAVPFLLYQYHIRIVYSKYIFFGEFPPIIG